MREHRAVLYTANGCMTQTQLRVCLVHNSTVFAIQQGLYARVNVLTYFMGRVHFVGGHDVWWVDDQNIVKSGNAKLDFLYNLHTEVLMSANESRHRRRNPPSATVPCRIPVRCQPSDLFPVVAEGRSQPSANFVFSLLPPRSWDFHVLHFPFGLCRHYMSQPKSGLHSSDRRD